LAFIRPAILNLEKRLREPARHIQVVLGPRQVGKTTGVRQVMDRWKGSSIYDTADLPLPPTSQWVENAWMRARVDWQTSKKPVLLALDEVQKVPRWSETVKRFWDEDRHERRDIRPVLLGSSAVLVAAGLAESLAGRFETNHLGHWDYEEMRDAFRYDLDTFLFHGGSPGAATLVGPFQRTSSWGRVSTSRCS